MATEKVANCPILRYANIKESEEMERPSIFSACSVFNICTNNIYMFPENRIVYCLFAIQKLTTKYFLYIDYHDDLIDDYQYFL